MFQALFRPFNKLQRKNKHLFDLWQEVNANLERYYVIDQRQFISSGFELQVWEAVRCFSGPKFSTEVLEYAALLNKFNRAFEDMKQFESFYSSSVLNKTRANAEILHAKKEILEEMAKELQPRIIGAREQLRSVLEAK